MSNIHRLRIQKRVVLTWAGAFAFGIVGGFAAHGFLGATLFAYELREWARLDAIRDSARWGLMYATESDARAYATQYVDALSECRASKDSHYPCSGRLAVESYLVLATVEADASNQARADELIGRAVEACRASRGDCDGTTARTSVERLLEKRRATFHEPN